MFLLLRCKPQHDLEGNWKKKLCVNEAKRFALATREPIYHTKITTAQPNFFVCKGSSCLGLNRIRSWDWTVRSIVTTRSRHLTFFSSVLEPRESCVDVGCCVHSTEDFPTSGAIRLLLSPCYRTSHHVWSDMTLNGPLHPPLLPSQRLIDFESADLTFMALHKLVQWLNYFLFIYIQGQKSLTS